MKSLKPRVWLDNLGKKHLFLQKSLSWEKGFNFWHFLFEINSPILLPKNSKILYLVVHLYTSYIMHESDQKQMYRQPNCQKIIRQNDHKIVLSEILPQQKKR